MIKLFIAGLITGASIGAIALGYGYVVVLAFLGLVALVTLALFCYGIYYVLSNKHIFHGYDEYN